MPSVESAWTKSEGPRTDITPSCIAAPSEIRPMCHFASHSELVSTTRSSSNPGGLTQTSDSGGASTTQKWRRRSSATSKRMTESGTRHVVGLDVAAHRPQDHAGVEVLGRELEPAGAPDAQRVDHALELPSGHRQPVPAAGETLDDPVLLEQPQALAQERAGIPGRRRGSR